MNKSMASRIAIKNNADSIEILNFNFSKRIFLQNLILIEKIPQKFLTFDPTQKVPTNQNYQLEFKFCVINFFSNLISQKIRFLSLSCFCLLPNFIMQHSNIIFKKQNENYQFPCFKYASLS